MADTALRDLERQVNSGDATLAQLWAAQCRIYGHQWTNVVSTPRTVLYLHLCERCLTTRGQKLEEVRLPEIFTFTCSNGRVHAVKDITYTSNFKGICGRNLSTGRFDPNSAETAAACQQALKNSFKEPTCDNCLSLLNRDDSAHRKFARRRVDYIYKTMFRPISFQILNKD